MVGVSGEGVSGDRIARVQRELMEQPWWGSLPWTWQDKGGRLDAQDSRGCACALGHGSTYLHNLHNLMGPYHNLHNLMGNAGINND